jgi:Ca2+-binding RTX toxin-like protein
VFTGIASASAIYGGGVGGGGGGGGGFGVGTPVTVGRYTVYPTVRSVGGQPVIIWMVIPGEARWLKEFFEVRMVVSNLAPQPFTFTSGTASLDTLPAGLSLAPTAEPQQLAQALPDIPAGGSAAATWIVRGDEAGEYDLSATYAASLEPIGVPVSMLAHTAPGALHVWGGDALTMRVLAEERLFDASPYLVTVELHNVADVPIYNLGLLLKEDKKLNFVYQPREQLTRSIAELAPGATLSAEFVLVPTVGILTPLHLVEEISFVKKTGGNTEVATDVVSVPPRFPDDQRPRIAVSRAGSDVTITWDAVPGATDYQLFTTSAPELPFDPTPIATVPAGVTSITLPLGADLVGKHVAVSPTVGGRPDMVHRRVALLGGSYVARAASATTIDRAAVVGDGLMAGAGQAGAAGCGRTAGAFATVIATELGATGAGLAGVACDGAAAGNVAFASPGPSLDDAYTTGPQTPLATVTQATAVGAFAAAGEPDLVLAGFGATDLGLGEILAQCGHGCDTRWRATAQQVLRDRVYPRVYENLRALRAAHQGAVVVAFSYPTPVTAGSACATFGTGGGITAAESTFLADELYPWLQTTMRRAAINAGVNLVDVTPALDGHRACDPAPWVNGLLFDAAGAVRSGSFLPNDAGNAAIVAYLHDVVVDASGRLLLTNPPAEVLRVLAPQEEAPRRVPVTARQSGACDAATCAIDISVVGLRNGDRVDLAVDGNAPVPAEAVAGATGTVAVTVRVPVPPAPTGVLVEVSSLDRNIIGSAPAVIGLRPPVAHADSATVDEDGSVGIDVLANDSDPQGGTVGLASDLPGAPTHGTAAVEDDAVLGHQVVRYRPAADYCGPDSLTYQITTASGLPATGAVAVTVTCINDAPVLIPSSPVSTVEGTAARLTVGAADVDSAALTSSWSPTAGLNDATLVSPTFTPVDNGTSRFAVTVCDLGTPQRCTTLADAAVVNATNAPPAVTAVADTTGRAGTALTIDPIARYTDPGSADTHTASIDWGDGRVDSSVPANGGAVPGTHTYAAAGTFTVRVCVNDDDGGSACDTLDVTVQAGGPLLSVGDVQVTELDSGSVNVVLPVTLSAAPAKTVSINVTTVDGTATAPSDYTAKTATVSFTPTGALTKTVTIAVRGDLLAEPTETFALRVVEPAAVGIADGTGTVTVVDNDVCTVLGTSGNDVLTGTPGRDVICALSGDDQINGLGGNDDIRGDAGVDTVTYETAPAGVSVDLAAGVATDRGDQVLSGIEQVYGSPFDDTLTGGVANDLVIGLAGADTIVGGPGVDELDGGDGNDVVTAGDGNDMVFGGAGDDRLLGQAGADRLEGEDGADTLDGGDANDVLRGGAGADSLTGGLGNDRIDGQAGDDIVDAGDGADTVSGGDGADQLDGGLAADDVSGGAGADVVRGGDGNDTVQGDEGDDTVVGGVGDDYVTGDDGNDTLAGEAGRDRLNGGPGTNTLDGGDGIDNCRSGVTTACERP